MAETDQLEIYVRKSKEIPQLSLFPPPTGAFYQP